MYIHTYINILIYIYTNLYILIYVYAYVRVCVCIHLYNISTYKQKTALPHATPEHIRLIVTGMIIEEFCLPLLIATARRNPVVLDAALTGKRHIYT